VTRERFARTVYLGAATVALGWASLRCGVTDEVIAHIAPEAGPPVEAGALCQSNPDCVWSELYCMKAGCDAGSGICQFKGAGTCPNDLQLKCGCSGTFYYNDCLRRQNGESAVATDMTSCQPHPCDLTDAGSCSGGAYCAFATTPDCQVDPQRRVPSSCWALPQDCPSNVSFPGLPPFGPQVLSCGKSGGQCMGVCDAIKQRAPFSWLGCPYLDASAD
jgi:hypothetical protein